MKYCIIIPARYESTRLPGKPLLDLDGTPMVVRTYQQCVKVCPSSIIYVATDDIRVKEVCESYGIQVLMTSSQCLTGTDRIAECSKLIDYDIYINVQGDEPVFNPQDLLKIISSLPSYPEEIINGYCEISDEKQFRSTSVPKVVFRPDGRLLYMSRSAIPLPKNNVLVKAWRQVCIYAFPKKTLEVFSSFNKKTLIENIEDIEILRFLEAGLEVRMIQLSNDSIAVDLPEDIPLVLKAVKERNL